MEGALDTNINSNVPNGSMNRIYAMEAEWSSNVNPIVSGSVMDRISSLEFQSFLGWSGEYVCGEVMWMKSTNSAQI